MPALNGPPPETADELYEHAPVGYLTLDATGVIVRVNDTLAGWLGGGKADLVGQRLQQILTPGARIFYETHCAPILRVEGVLRQIALDLRRFDGSRLPALLEWNRVDGPNGRTLGSRIMVVDATERRSYERELLAERERARAAAAALAKLNAELEMRVETRTAELVQLRKMDALGQLTGGVAHDFNNLLTPIVACLDILSRRVALDPRSARLVSGAADAAERARILVSRLLAFARKQHLEARPVELGALLEGMRDLIARSLGPLVELQVEAEPDLPPARVDPNQLELAILNLCVNARDAMEGQGRLLIRLRQLADQDHRPARLPSGPFLTIEISDTGAGMSPEVLRRATEPFFTTKAVGRGTGLGLSMAEGLASQSGGALTIESVQGQGATVSILLPLASEVPAQARSEAPDLARPRTRRSRVLLVDDDDLVRTGVADLLRDLGHEVREAASGAPALTMIREEAPDLLITDFAMAGMTGLDLVEAAHKLFPGLPALLITGFANLSMPAGYQVPRLAKPFTTSDLDLAVARALEMQAPLAAEGRS